jgi:hypothetical protein
MRQLFQTCMCIRCGGGRTARVKDVSVKAEGRMCVNVWQQQYGADGVDEHVARHPKHMARM